MSVDAEPVTGKVVVASTGQGVAGVQADLFSSGNGDGAGGARRRPTPDGAFTFGRLAEPAATGCASAAPGSTSSGTRLA